MRIDKIYIQNYKNFRDVCFDFDETSFNTVVIGRNGVGKSNLLELLATIFSSLHLKQNSDFNYSIYYQIRGNEVKIDSNNGVYTFFVKEKEYKKINKSNFYSSSLLPENIFGYYSGHSKRLLKVFQPFLSSYIKQLKKDEAKALRPFVWISPEYAVFVLLTFFIDEDLRAQEFLNEYLSIESFSEIKIAFNEAYILKEMRAIDEGHPSSPTYRLYEMLSSTFQSSVSKVGRVQDLKAKREIDLIFTIISVEQLRQIFNAHSPRDIFRLFENSFLLESKTELSVSLRLVNGSTISSEDLSEGQLQILLILGTMRFNQSLETLYLLDEPDTQLNPKWSSNFLNIISEFTSFKERAQVVMTTHSPIVFSGLNKSEVLILSTELNGNVVCEAPDRDPKGLGISNILTSEFFDLESSFDGETYDLMKKRRSLLIKSKLSSEEKEELHKLNEVLFESDFMSGDRDRLYINFLKILSESKPEFFSTGKNDEYLDVGEFEKIIRDLK